MKMRLIGILLLVCMLAGCAQPSLPAIENEYNIDTDRLPCSQEQLYSMLFDLENKITLRLDMENSELAKMQEDYDRYANMGSKSPIYRKGDLHISITTPKGNTFRFLIEEVGVRMKGNTSRTDFYNSLTGIYNIIHLKLSFQETFDEGTYYGADAKEWSDNARKLRKNRTFATLEKLDLRWNHCDDGTYLKEYFAYETYRQYGVPAPRTNLTSFQWAGNHMGVFTINEPVDSVFLAKLYPASVSQGDLYKCGWAGNRNGNFLDTASIGIEDEDKCEFYAYDLKTNKKTSQHQSLISFIQEMNSGNMTKERFAELVDIDTFIPYCAVSYLLGNPDDMRNNYNNFYVYFRSDNGKAVFIPYDYDRCLGVTAHWNPTQTGVTDDDPFTLQRQAIDRDDRAEGSIQRNPVLLYSIVEGGFYMEAYADCLRRINEEKWFQIENFNALYETAKANYSDLTTPSKEFYNTKDLYQSFDIHRTSDFSSNGNISMAEYLEAKTATMNQALNNMAQYTKNNPQIAPIWYLRADFTDWNCSNDYLLSLQDGLWYIPVQIRWKSAMKIYNSVHGGWYGSECVAEDSPIKCTTDGHTNIVLQPGSYRITIDPMTNQITINKE